MAIDETDLPNGTVGTPTDEARGTDAAGRYPVEDFRLRLDSPLFHRDAGLGAGGTQAPSLRELTWEHVVRPNAHQAMIAQETAGSDGHLADPDAAQVAAEMADLLASLKPVSAAPTLTIESMLVQRGSPIEKHPVGEVLLEEEGPPITETRIVAPVVDDDGVAPHGGLPSLSSLVSPPQPASTGKHAVQPAVVALDDLEPVSMEPPIETLLAALKHMDEVEQQYMPAPQQRPPQPAPEVVAEVAIVVPPDSKVRRSEPDHAPAAEPEPAADPAPLRAAATQSPVPLAGLERTRANNESTVEAELNRLAYLPDLEDEQGPVEVPAIARAEQPAMIQTPALSQHEMYAPRQSAPAAHPRTLFADIVASSYMPPRKKKRGVIRRLFAFVVLLGLIGGGLFAAKYYLLDPQWKGEMKAVAEDVEQARGLEFDHAVTVTTLPVDAYTVELATRSLGLVAGTLDAIAGEWRALGLLNGELDLRAIGLAALADSPAFYDPASETIYVAGGLPEQLARFGLRRALALALLDQVYGWGSRVDGASGSVASGTRALYDADALATAVAMTSDAERNEIIMQMFGIYVTFEIAPSPSPYATAAAGRLGVALQPFVESVPAAERSTLLDDAAISDGQALDLRRLVSGAQEAPTATSRGMLFWYHVLASRLDNNTAWATALAWRGDVVSTVAGINGVCVVANVSVDPSAIDGATAAFQQWAAAGPPGAAAVITAATVGTDSQVTVTSCDPGAAVPTNDGRPRLSLGGAPLRAEQYRQLLTASPTLVAAQVACAVFGADGVSMADERGVVDPISGWTAPAAHPAPDPNRLGCTG